MPPSLILLWFRLFQPPLLLKMALLRWHTGWKVDSEWKQWSIFFCISEGERAEAWLKEAGLEGLYDSSLEGNSDQVSLVYSSFIFALCMFGRTYMWLSEWIDRKKTTWGSCRRSPERRRQLSNVGGSRPTRHSGGVSDRTLQMLEIFSDLLKWWGRRCTQMTLSDHFSKYTLSNFGEHVQFTTPMSADSISINHPVSMQSTQEVPSTLIFE